VQSTEAMKTEIFKVHPQFPEREKIAHCAERIRQGGLVVFPTETVYGIAADFHNALAVKRLRDVKGRSAQKPFTVMVPRKEAVLDYTNCRLPGVFKVIDQYWPGPLTVILSGKDDGSTIGMRMPAHHVALALVQMAECALAAPSANRAGCAAPRTCDEALADLDGLVDCALDAGPSDLGQASTVVDMTEAPPVILREGAVTEEDIHRILGKKIVLMICTGNSCRSVMAEYLLRDRLKNRTDIEVISAGTNVFVTSGASTGALEVLRRRGIEAQDHRSRPINTILLHKADLILVMGIRHQEAVLRIAPEVAARTYLLKEFSAHQTSPWQGLDIGDPMGQEAAAYEECARTIEQSLDRIVEIL